MQVDNYYQPKLTNRAICIDGLALTVNSFAFKKNTLLSAHSKNDSFRMCFVINLKYL